ncbi:MAG: exodeoxyribonuclease V subunit alpha [Candidatus Nanopelagicales bacterium]
MTTLTRLPLGVLTPFHAGGILNIADVQIAAALLRVGGHSLEDPDGGRVGLGAALCVRALRAGSVCVDLTADPAMWVPQDEETTEPAAVHWPDPDDWLMAARQHPLVAQGPDGPLDRPLRLVGTLLYLERYWQDEQLIRTEMQQRGHPVVVDPAVLAQGLQRLFPGTGPDRQRLAAATAALRQATIIAGGPGTGKTTTVARIIALLREVDGTRTSIALAAPTGKAAARLQEAVATAAAGMDPDDRDRVGDVQASTVHRLLGWRPDSRGRFTHDRSNRLPHDVVIIDETSMVSLPLMARLLEAVRPDARLVLVGDPDQLASIDAGAVLGDLVAAPASSTGRSDLAATLLAASPADAETAAQTATTGVVVLDRNYRFGEGAISELSAAIRRDDAERVLAVLRSAGPDVEFVEATDADALRGVRADVVAQTDGVVQAAVAGDSAAALAHLESHRVLCAHREGPYGVTHWNDLIEGWTQHLVPRSVPGEPWYVGRPLLVTANDYSADLYNGDTGVVVAATDGGVRAAFRRGSGFASLTPARLSAVQTLNAMTIHRGQGSQFDAVTIVLPPPESPLLTRELLYTAVTRARSHIRVIGTEDAVRAAVGRQVRRASGLRTQEHPRNGTGAHPL